MKNLEEGNYARRVLSGEEDLVICDVPASRCEIRGHYWRCYLDGYTKCDIRKTYKNSVHALPDSDIRFNI